MRKRIFISSMVLLVAVSSLSAQPKAIERPAGFDKLIGPATFDPAKLREAIAFPIAQFRLRFYSGEKGGSLDIPPIAVIEQELKTNGGDANLLFLLGQARAKEKLPGAKDAYEKSVAAYRKRIEKEPSVAQHYFDITDPLSELNRPMEILAAAKKCVELDPNHAAGWYALGLCHWQEFKILVYGKNSGLTSLYWPIDSTDSPPEIPRPLTDAEKDRARSLLKSIYQYHQHWKRCAPDGVFNVAIRVAAESYWDLFDRYFQSGTWSIRNDVSFRIELSKKAEEKIIAYGRKNEDPIALGFAVYSQLTTFALESQDERWAPSKLTATQKKEIDATMPLLEKLADHKDKTVALKADVILAIYGRSLGDKRRMDVYAAKALSLAPREKLVIDTAVATQQAGVEFHKFWEEHVQRHPSPRVWLQLSFTHFREKKYEDTERCIREGEKLDPKDRSIQLAKVALMLKRGDAERLEAGRILDALKKRLGEPVEKDSLFGGSDLPTFQDSYRYLRAIHTALSGKWEQGRDELIALRERDVLTEEITAALEAFPQPAMVLPAELKREK